MKASGGLKRLFITEREAYLQRANEAGDQGWTWPKLRDLPRYPAADTNDSESYWEHHQFLDSPLSLHSSFASHDSHQLSPVPLTGAALESSIKLFSKSSDIPPAVTRDLSAKATFVPITPVTNPSQDFNIRSAEFPYTSRPSTTTGTSGSHYSGRGTVQTGDNNPGNTSSVNPRYNLRRHGRTVSNPQFAPVVMLAPDPQVRSFSASLAAGGKRGRGFDNPSNPLIASLPSFVPSPTKKGFNQMRRGATASHSNSPNQSLADTVLIDGPEVSGNNSNKRRRLSRPRSPSVVSNVHMGKTGGVMTPGPGPYATPYSGNFVTFSESGPGSNDAESWKGVEEEDDEGDVPARGPLFDADEGGKVAPEYESEEEDDDDYDDDEMQLFDDG